MERASDFDSVGLSFGSSLSSYVVYQLMCCVWWFLTTIKFLAARYVRLYIRCTKPVLSFGRAIGQRFGTYCMRYVWRSKFKRIADFKNYSATARTLGELNLFSKPGALSLLNNSLPLAVSTFIIHTYTFERLDDRHISTAFIDLGLNTCVCDQSVLLSFAMSESF